MLNKIRTTSAFGIIILTVVTTTVSGFSQPKKELPLSFRPVNEQLESMIMQRIRLDGQNAIQMDSPDYMYRDEIDGVSFALVRRYLPNCKFLFYAYPDDEIPGGLSRASVTSYVNALAEKAARNDEPFEILGLPDPTDGRPLIRFLGAKPITVTYTVTRLIEDQPIEFIIRDSWASMRGNTYLLRIEAPAKNFDSFFSQCRLLAGSMHFVD